MSEEKDFVTICVVCTKGVTRDELKFVNGRVFHPECYEKHGKDFLVVNQDLLHRSANAKIELVQLRNLKIRKDGNPNPRRKSKTRTKKRTRKSRRVKKRGSRRITKRKTRRASSRRKARRR
jgi:putative cell wall-binding protein